MANSELFFLLIITTPILSALFTTIFKRHKLYYSCMTCFAASINLWLLSRLANDRFSLEAFLFNFDFEGYSFLFALLVNLTWLITVIYSFDYLTYHFPKRESEFNTWLSISVSLILCTGFSANIWTLLFFYTLSGLSILILLERFKNSDQKVMGVYLSQVIAPPLLVIVPACLYLDIFFIPFKQLSINELGISDQFASLLLGGFIIFFSKNCVIPFHSWLGRISFAPAPLSALVHTVGAVQTGVIAILKITREVYGYEYLQYLNSQMAYTGWITYLCGITAVYTAYKAWKTNSLKERFSYSTVGQLSYIISAILIGTKTAILGGLLHIVTHGLAKITLFFAAGIFSTAFSVRDTASVAKIAPHVSWLSAIIVLCGISISGLPFLAGFYSKETIFFEELDTKHYEAAIFLLCGSFVNLLYIFPFFKALISPYLGKEHKPLHGDQYNKNIKLCEVVGTLIPFIILMLISMLMNFNNTVFNDFLFKIIEK